MKIAIAQIKQETNTFNPIKTTMNTFLNSGFERGQEILSKFNTNELRAFITILRKAGAEIAPLMATHAQSGGVATYGTIEGMAEHLTDSLKEELPIDGILLALHGAMVAERVSDAEGYLLERVRKIVGPEFPIVVTFDLHACITDRKINNSTAIVGYRTAPHIDLYETGERAAKLLSRIMKERIRPQVGFIKLPIILPPENASTEEGPLKQLFDLIHSSDQDENILCSSLFPVQPWLDIQESGSSVLIYGLDKTAAQRWASRIAEELWNKKDEFRVVRTPLEKAIDEASSHVSKPVVIADSADSTNSGAPGDSTILLSEMLRQKIQCEALITMVDPHVAKLCAETGVGRQVSLELGGKRDIFSRPLKVEGKVRTIFDGQYVVSGHGGQSVPWNTGITVVLEIKNIKIVITEFPSSGSHPAVYRTAGLEPKEAQIVVVKSPRGFRADYSFAAKVIIPETPGLATPDFKQLPYKNLPRPFYPFDGEEKFQNLMKELGKSQ